ncbi:hypothetical protein PR048_013692 [Dryococelus australis]|uniref:Uncharacterized protein n=1 Tax=Dryococelus australis TaxID=614101 RepID=A0ABQ9HSV5_9NEOP|nr:hypothetical protein PR048_013692 [Dryococelus australis]
MYYWCHGETERTVHKIKKEANNLAPCSSIRRREINNCACQWWKWVCEKWKASQATGDYHTIKLTVKWLREKLIPNMPCNSVFTTDNVPYHCVPVNKDPTPNSRKELQTDLVNTEYHFCTIC